MITNKLIKITVRLYWTSLIVHWVAAAFQVTMNRWRRAGNIVKNDKYTYRRWRLLFSLSDFFFFLLFKIEWKCSGRKLYTRGNWESANPNKGGNWREEGRRAPFTGSSSISNSFVPSPLSESLEQALDRRHIDLKEEPKAVYVQRVSSGKRFLLCGRPAKLTGMTLEGGSCCTERVLI